MQKKILHLLLLIICLSLYNLPETLAQAPKISTVASIGLPYLSTIRADTSTYYRFRTNWGNYSFLKTQPYMMNFVSKEGATVTNSTFWIVPQNTILVFPFSPVILLNNATMFRVSIQIRYVSTIIAYLNQTWNFNPNLNKPKVSVLLTKTAQWTQGNFQLIWILQGAYIKINSFTAIQTGTGSYNWLRNDTVCEIGKNANPQTWLNWTVCDWGDTGISQLGQGTLSLSGAGGFKIQGPIIYFAINKANIDPSTVGTSTISTATQYSTQRKSFHANGRFWVFYSDGTNMVCRNSTDGTTWSNAVTIRACTAGVQFSLYFDGTYFHYVYCTTSSLYYRRGTPNSGGTITWSAAEQTVSTTLSCTQCPSIAVDSSGYIWISYIENWQSPQYPYIIKSGNNDGTWGSTPSGFPYKLSTTDTWSWFTCTVSLTSGKMAVFYCQTSTSGYIRVQSWTGSTWQSEATTGNTLWTTNYYSAVAQGDNVHVTYLEGSGSNLRYVLYNYTTNTFTGDTNLATVSSTSGPCISMDTNTNNLYIFYAGTSANHIYYYKRTGTSWGSTDWLTEVALTANDRLTCFYSSYSSYIGLLYMNKTGSPYQIRFAYLTLNQALTGSATLAITTSFASTRLFTGYRTSTLAITTSFAPSRVYGAARTSTLGITASLTSSRIYGAIRASALAITTSFAGSRVYNALRTTPLGITTSFTSSRIYNANRASSLAITTSFTSSRINQLARSITLPISLSIDSSRIYGAIRSATETITASFDASKLFQMGRIASLDIATAFTAARQANYGAFIDNPIVTTWEANWPVPPPPPTVYDPGLLFFFLLIPIIIGFICLFRFPLVSMICGIILIAFSAMIALNPYVATDYTYYNGAWLYRTETFPLHPQIEIIFIIIGVIYILAPLLRRNG